jgi:Ca2+-binding RTX toxin-like protein
MTNIIGTAAAETLVGTAGDDIITGNGGTDTIEAGRGNDIVTGGDDADRVYGEAGNDQIDGGGGNDVLVGGAGNDLVHGGDGNDSLYSTERTGSDTLFGDAGDDYIEIDRFQGSGTIAAYGGAGSDRFWIDVRTGATAAIDGGDGDDYVELESWDAAATVTLGAGRDLLLMSTLGTFTGTSGIGVTVMDFQTGAGGDVANLTDALADYAPSWNGSINPFTAGLLTLTQSGADAILRFQGSLVFVFKNVSAASFTAENFAGISPTGTLSPILNLTGDAERNVLSGGSGDDVIDGAGGSDYLYGGFGADTLSGGDGNDRIEGGAGNDQIDGGAGRDSLYGGFGDDVLHGGGDDDFLTDNDSGTDILYGDAGNDDLWVQRHSRPGGGSSTLVGGDGDDRLNINITTSDAVFADGGVGDDKVTIYSLAGSLTATLGDGADLIDLGAWNKSATSAATITVTDFATGAGGDRLEWTRFLTVNAIGMAPNANPFASGYARLVQSGADVLLQFDRDGGANSFVTLVTFKNSSAAAFASFNLGGFSADGSAVAGLTLAGTDGADRLIGDGGTDTIDGLGDKDSIYGLGGADTIHGGDGADTIYGGGGDDVIEGGADNDTLAGEQGNDVVHGGLGNDYLSDTIGGADALYGDEGNDTLYVYRGGGTDSVLVDGGIGDDWIQLQAYAGTINVSGGDGDDTLQLLALGATANVSLGAGQDRIYLYDFTFQSFAPGSLVLTDFQAGDGGDRFDWDHWLATDLRGYDTATSPFLTGFLKLVQVGADVVLQVSQTGTGGTYTNWITFKNTDIWSLTPYNFDGYETPYTTVHGTGADETFYGSTGNDSFDGGGGNDTFLIGYGGNDRALGGAGDDTAFVALTVAPGSHIVSLAGGNDLLQLQGHGAQAITLGTSAASGTLIQASGVETVQLLASADPSRNWGAGAAAAYTLTLQDNVTAAGSTLVVDASGLAAADSLTFTTDETDATLHLTGGAGADRLTGGAGSDQLDGGAGNDVLNYIAHAGGIDIDTVTGGAGTDVLNVGFAAVAGPLTWSLTPDGLGGYSGWFQTDPDHRVDFTGIERFAIGGTAASEDLAGGDGNDLIVGEGGDDVLHGNGGADLLTGAAGIDTLIGGAGNDLYVVDGPDDVSDVIVELDGEGIDEVDTDFASYTLGANLENLSGTSATGQILTGNALANIIAGFTGNDVIDGGAGADTMQGGAGNDVYYVDDLGDTVSDSSGTDEIRTALASYTIGPSSGVENLTGLASTGQSLTGSSGNNLITGGDGNDLLDGGAGVDTLRGGKGDDTYYVDNRQDFAVENAGEGYDTVFVSSSSFTLSPNIEAMTGTSAAGQNLLDNSLDNVVTGAGGADIIRLTFGGADKAFGNGGNDVIYFNTQMTSADEVDGGAGSDTVALQGSNYSGIYFPGGLTLGANLLVNVETLLLMTNTDTRYGGSDITGNAYNLISVDSNVAAGTQLFVDGSALAFYENLVFNGSAETDGTFKVTGGAAADTITGGAGADLLTGGSGDDTLDGGAGADTLTGGSGNDAYVVDSVSDTVTELAGGGADEIRTALAAYTLTAANVETLRGTSASGQSLTAGAAGQTIIGGTGADTLDDGGFAATLKGGLGDDVYAVHAAAAGIVENGGEGTDTVRSYVASYALGANLENLVGMLSTGQTLTGNASANAIAGGSGDDRLDGGAGADTMTGGLGDDTYVVDNAGDVVTENAGEGTDTVETNLAAYTLADNVEKLTGTSAAGQALTGNSAANTLTGGSGNDTLVGGAGNDTLIGGLGTDTASYATGGAITVSVSSAGTGQVVVGPSDTDTFSSVERIVGSAFSDSFSNDSAGGMTFVGGDGNDTYYLFGAGDTVVEAAGGGGDKVVTNAAAYTLAANVENLTGTLATGQDLRGNAGDNEILGAGGDDVIRLQDGGRDHGSGGAGNDSLYFGGALDSLDLAEGGLGYDLVLLQGNYANLTIGANLSGIDGLELMSRTDARYGGAGATPTSYVIASSGVQTASQFFFVDGRNLLANETLSFDATAETGAGFWVEGGAGADTLRGGLLDDHFNGNAGADYMAGGKGNDVYYVDDAGDQVVEAAGEGSDIVRTTLASYTLAANAESVVGDLNTGQHLTGNGLDNVFEAGDGDDVLDGGAGNDNMIGRGGNDVYIVDSLADGVFENAGQGIDEVRTALVAYTLGANVEKLTGISPAAQSLRGNALDNFVAAGAGNDTILLQDGGADRATGGDGDDVIWFGASFGAGDRADGGAGNDEVVLQGGGYGALSVGAGMLGGVQRLTLLSAGDARFGTASAGAAYQYGITLGAGALAAGDYLADGFFTYTLLVDGRGLAAGESLTLDASAIAGARVAATGGAGNDHLAGGAGADSLNDGAGGDDLLEGGGGDDIVQDFGGGSDVLRGGGGNDALYLFRAAGSVWSTASLEGGDGDDSLRLDTSSSGAATIDGGAGDDFVDLARVAGSVGVTLGAGRDTLYLEGGALQPGGGAIAVADFATGAGGDVVDMALALTFRLGAGYSYHANPFADGFARLVQSGADTLLQLSERADGSFVTVVTFQNRVAGDFTAENFGGWALTPTVLAPGATFAAGTSGGDWLVGTDTATFFDLSQGGIDYAKGGAGGDAFYFGAALDRGDRVDGGAGKDVVALQGNYLDTLLLGGGMLQNVETLSLLTHSDARFGGGGAGPFSYKLMTDDSAVAAGTQLIVNASTLEAGENLTFDGHLETDGSFFIYGGQGNDTLTGGAKVDVFFFGENGRFGSGDHVDGGAGADILVLRGDYHIVMDGASMTNIETVTLMSGADARFAPAGTPFHYDISTADNTVAAGATMTFNGGDLAAGETLHFDGSAETNGAFRVFGGKADDVLIGGGGADLLFGGLGADALTGGGGNDMFRYQSASESTASALDHILDFASGDRIDVSRMGHFDFLGSAAFDGHAGELRAENVGGNVWSVQADTDGDGAADFVLNVTVADNHALTNADFTF